MAVGGQGCSQGRGAGAGGRARASGAGTARERRRQTGGRISPSTDLRSPGAAPRGGRAPGSPASPSATGCA